MIIEMRPIVVNILQATPGLVQFSSTYPNEWNSFPLAIYSVVRKPIVKDANGIELRSKWTITIEVYTDNVSPTSISNHIEERFRNLGFKSESRDANTGNLMRRICTVTGVIDNTLHLVHSD